MNRRLAVRVIQLFLLVAGLSAFAYCGWARHQIASAQSIASAFGRSPDGLKTSQDAGEQLADDVSSVSHPEAIIGRIDIPQIALSAPITASITKEGLLRGAGHVPGTALPGGLGTMGIAGHRDTFFRPLRNIRRGMEIRVIGSTGAYRYRVDSTEVVDPEDVSVLNIDAQPMLTLITCYPFHYIGAAPRRFIVHAHLLSVAPESR